MSHPKLYHVTRNKSDIASKGFSGKARTTLEGGAGAYFGEGTYFHTEKGHSDEYLSGMRAFGYGDEEQIEVSADVKKPFTVQIGAADQNAVQPGEVMKRALIGAGLAHPGDRLSPAEITRRLKAAGYDSVRVKQPKFSHEIAGDQLVVFDATQAKYGHGGSSELSGGADKPKRVAVDIVSPGTALISAGGRQARVGREDGRYYVEDTDTEEVIGRVSSYKAAGRLAAKHWGFADVPIELDKE